MGSLTRLFGGAPEVKGTDEPTALGDQRGDLPPGALALYAGVGGTDVVGESNYRDAIDRIVDGPYRGGVKCTYWAQVIPEEGNRFDANAVAVLIHGERVGYLRRSDAKRYRLVLEDLQRAQMDGFVRCDIWYGWHRSRSDVGGYSLRIYMDTPERQAELLVKQGITTRGAEPPERARKRASNPQSASGRVVWHSSRESDYYARRLARSGPVAPGDYQMDYEGDIGEVLVADIEKRYDPERWMWYIRVPISGPDQGFAKRLRDAKAEVEHQLADWQP